MNTFIKNILLFAVAIILSYFTAEYFGSWYDRFSPQYDNTFGVGKDLLISLVGGPFAYVFFITLLLKLFGSGNQNKWTGWLLVPPFLFFASGDLKHIYLPIILALIAFGLAALLRKIFKTDDILTESSHR